LIDLGKLHSSFASQLRCKTLEATQHARVPAAHSPSSRPPPPNYLGFHRKSWKHPPGVQEFFNSQRHHHHHHRSSSSPQNHKLVEIFCLPGFALATTSTEIYYCVEENDTPT